MVGDLAYRKGREPNTAVGRQGRWGGTNREGRGKEGTGENWEKKISKRTRHWGRRRKKRRRKESETKLERFGALPKLLVHFILVCRLAPAGRQGGSELFCRT